ncbi:MAG: hypothetical protein OEW35_00150 [Gammaproteobacteria bacterium]|nr:hypothetical protein [Gammaproteobacteria bacterium]MDH4252913.1 hypothetical protein [Gammaproteobacteria bacterium]MDH5308401.1 hypothetical protein [Gammaproteobacteria bacterium]
MTPNNPYRIVTVAGADRVEFLQGQLTQDLGLLEAGGALPAAWCNARGRVLVTGTLLGLEDRVGFAVPADMAAAVVGRLGMYRLRARVEIAAAGDDWSCVAARGRAARLPGAAVASHERNDAWFEIYGRRDDVARSLSGRATLAADEWRRRRIAAGLPDIGAAASERYTPHMLNLDRVGALSFSKGCYTGQEVVARTEHLGSVKRRLARFRVSDHAPIVGDRLGDDSGDVGEVVTAAGSEMLALLPIELHGRSFRLGAGRAEPLPLPWDGA